MNEQIAAFSSAFEGFSSDWAWIGQADNFGEAFKGFFSEDLLKNLKGIFAAVQGSFEALGADKK